MHKLSEKFEELAEFLEIVLAIIITIGVIVGLAKGVSFIKDFTDISALSYESFKEFLKYILMLVVGVEFVLMLLTHSIDRIVELVVFVIARKMLVYGSSMLDMVLGSIAVAVVFATIKYLKPNNKK